MSQRAIITGAGRGIGRSISMGLAEAGVDVILVSRTLAELKETQALIGSKVSVNIIQADVSSTDSVVNLHKQIQEDGRAVDFLVNNAGYAERVSIEETDEASWDKMINVNLSGTYRMIRSFLPLLKQSKGKVLNISSLAGTSGYEKFPGFGAYSAAKAGVVALTEVLAVEHKEDGVDFYCISPGGVKTQMLASVLPDFEATMVPKDIADKAVELLLENTDVVSGENVVVA